MLEAARAAGSPEASVASAAVRKLEEVGADSAVAVR